MTPIRRLAWCSLALVALVGCDTGVQTPMTPPSTPAGGTAGNGAGGTAGASSPEPKASTEIKAVPVPDKADAKPLSQEQIAEIKKLPADEQPIALAQKVCPVSGDALGGEMGVPIKQKIGDKTFYICCASCEAKVKSQPDQVLAALAKLAK